MDKSEPRSDVASLHRIAATAMALAAFAVAVLNALTAPEWLVARGPIAVFVTPQVLGISILAAFAAISASSFRLRWVEVGLLVAVGLFSTATADEPQLTSLVYGSLGLALAVEYGYLKRRPMLKIAIWCALYVLALLVPVLRGTMASGLDAAKTFAVAVLVGLIVTAIIRVRLDLHARREYELEALVAERTAKLDEALHVQEVLLSEIHHRTKNNLQLVSSMLSFVEGSAPTSIREQVEAARRRIIALARVHELLYSKTSVDVTKLAAYLRDYVVELRAIVEPVNLAIDPLVTLQSDVPLDTAVRIALIVNEIAMMAMDRAVKTEASGVLHFEAREDSGVVLLQAREDESLRGSSAEIETTLGVRIIGALVETLGGTWEIDVDEDVRWRVVIPLEESGEAVGRTATGGA